MQENKTVHLRNLTEAELEHKLRELNEELFNLRFRNSMKQLEDPLRIREIRRGIARVKTVIDESRRGIRPLTRREGEE
jgi:large subunit ribosomal protein L29